GHPHDQPVEDRHPFRPPSLGRLGDERIDLGEPRDRVVRERGRERAQRVRRRRLVGPLELEERPRGAIDRRLADLPLIENLQRRLARAMPRVLSFHDRGAGGLVNAATTSAISNAASAASRPLLSGPSPARASASSTEFVVSTPSAIGTPVAAAPAVRPWATAEQMYSKCGVSPRITHPRQTIAWNRPVSAACCAAIGISKAPGTRTIVMSPSATPAPRSAATAPVCRRSVTNSLYFETTSANRYATYRPLNSGFRLSRNARVPSRMSSVDATRPNSVASYWHASANGISAPLLTALMMYFIAIGALAASCAASARTAVISSAAGTTRLTRPMRSASSAVIGAPVRISSIARPRPTRRDSRRVPA